MTVDGPFKEMKHEFFVPGQARFNTIKNTNNIVPSRVPLDFHDMSLTKKPFQENVLMGF